MNKLVLCKLLAYLEHNGKIEEMEEVQNLMDLFEIAIDSIHKIEQIKKIVGIEVESD